jgi:hypothetical protein
MFIVTLGDIIGLAVFGLLLLFWLLLWLWLKLRGTGKRIAMAFRRLFWFRVEVTRG